MSQYSFNLDDHRERLTARKVLDAIEPVQTQAYGFDQRNSYGQQSRYSQNVRYSDADYQQMSAKNKELQQQNKDLEDKLKTDADQIAKLQKSIEEKDAELKEWNDMASSLDAQNKVKDQEIVSLKDEISRLRTDRNSIEQKLNSRISDLQRRIESYEPSFVGTDGEEQYFAISDNGYLTQTNSVDAPYKAKVFSSGKASYQFNTEKGPCQDACNNKRKYLLPFCDIEEDLADATGIRPSTWGEAVYNSNTGDLTITSKAKVKLVRY
jgi:hypothetical protein